ncbi:ABC transporter permease [Sedimentibacter hydroxybenzoicus DSM 7310]|uniref:Nickel import system permease protein NikB n=1 Tax=Sedimentibacter hydroxybenzoicus DSM 7310 TaxID=1123245 RepID=A0A974BL06_SEDHY|nr:nickel ABC transporter permease [Sedimentibacter hydroxybenzoicus]NYB75285.1 ABC transporter permease [Sedimentibacter hydroxybenzoicus DSM 7310]
MLKYIIRRIIMMIPVMLGVTFVVFTMLYITPGDPAQTILGENATEETIAELREEMGLDRPFIIQYFDYVWKIVTKGDFGRSYTNQQPVINALIDRFPNTIILAVSSAAIAVILGLILGVVSAVKQYSIFDNFSMTLALIGLSMPNFWQGLLLMLLFSLKLGWFPVSGFTTWKHLILPALTVGTSSCAIIARMTRSSMLEVVRQDYVDSARAKGQKEYIVIIKHALRNAMIPIITAVGLQFGAMLGGSVITESVFSIPGIGKLMVDSIKARDYPSVQAGVLLIALSFCVVNLLVDLLYAATDPRMKSNIEGKA